MEENRSNEIWEVAVAACEILSCENCPVTIHKADYRTKHEKENMHVPCCENLYKWLVKAMNDNS